MTKLAFSLPLTLPLTASASLSVGTGDEGVLEGAVPTHMLMHAALGLCRRVETHYLPNHATDLVVESPYA